MKANKRQRGFTLIELLVVIAIIGIVATVAVGSYQRSILKAKEATLKEDLYIMRQSINLYFADKGRWPLDLQDLVDEKYLMRVPVDPLTESSETWITEYAEISDQDISTEQGIANVRSGSSGTSLDGSAYADW